MSLSSAPAQVVSIDRKHFVWGLEWRLLPTEQTLSRSLKSVKQEGYDWYVTSDMEDIIGLSPEIPEQRLSMYSAALHLSERMSQGVLELYAFALREELVAVIALNEYRVIPGFDFIGPPDKAKALIDEFEAIQVGQTIRRMGNRGLLRDEQSLDLRDVFSDPSSDTRLHRFYKTAHLKWLAAVTVAMGLAFAGANYYLQKTHEDNIAARPPVPVNPNPAYQEKVAGKFQTMGPMATHKLQHWVVALRQIPLQHQGWQLTKVECKDQFCTANWRRNFGSLNDFVRQLPPGAKTAKEFAKGEDALIDQIETQHPVPSIQTSSPWSFNHLPLQTPGQRDMASWLQDMSLLGAPKHTLQIPKIWGVEGDAALLTKPLYQGAWSLNLQLHLTTLLQIPAFAQINVLTLDVPNNFFQLAGDYYVQADHP